MRFYRQNVLKSLSATVAPTENTVVFFNCIFGHLIASAAPWGFCRPGQSVYFNYLPHHRGDIYIFDYSGAPPWRFCRPGQSVYLIFPSGTVIIFSATPWGNQKIDRGGVQDDSPPSYIIYIYIYIHIYIDR